MSVTVMLGGSVEEISPAVETAIDLTKRLKTSLTGFCAMPDPANAAVYITGAETVIMGASAIASLTEAQDNLVKEFKQAFSEQTGAAGPWLHARFERETGSVAVHGAARAALADAFVVSKASTQSNHPMNQVFEHVLMEAGLPLVLSPNQARTSDTCMIAWDGSPLAARTVKLYLPLIATYKKVVIAEHADKVRHQWAHVCQNSRAQLIEILHEQRLDVVEAELSGTVSSALLEAADAHDASLIVMGAYGHNRLGQMLFGGTTSKLLHSKDAPALALCH